MHTYIFAFYLLFFIIHFPHLYLNYKFILTTIQFIKKSLNFYQFNVAVHINYIQYHFINNQS